MAVVWFVFSCHICVICFGVFLLVCVQECVFVAGVCDVLRVIVLL